MKAGWLKIRWTAIAISILTLASESSFGHGEPPANLIGIRPPSVKGLIKGPRPIIVDEAAARMLGKSFFWDQNLGSDGVSCATCHYHAGADARPTNQMNPGQRHVDSPTARTFQLTASGSSGGIAYRLKPTDFPTWQFQDPSDKNSPVIFSTDDVVGSGGAFMGQFLKAEPQGTSIDQCTELSDPIFHSGSLNSRQTTDRNAPSVINAVFNFRNFWDGRANNIFNGENNWGLRDRKAGAWVRLASGKVVKRNLNLADASLASQAVAPLNNDVEMACKKRTFADVAVKILDRKALENQTVSPEDYELGPMANPNGKGLKVTYGELIRKAFDKRYWSGNGNFGTSPSGVPYTMIQANLPMFFGLSILAYESTLISNHSPYDTPVDAGKVPRGLTPSQREGLNVFLNAHCFNCHGTAAFTAAAEPYLNTPKGAAPRLVQRREIDPESPSGSVPKLQDVGFANTSVVPTDYDIGAGGVDEFGVPLAYSGEYLNALAIRSNYLVDGVRVYACDFEVPFVADWSRQQLIRPKGTPPGKTCKGAKDLELVPRPAALKAERAQPDHGKAATAMAGAFKISSLRNVELTGPYFHNGSVKNLSEVIDFYGRGGNVTNPGHSSVFVFPQPFTPAEKASLIDFLRSLTDEDVRWERGVFSHPELTIPVQNVSNQQNAIRPNLMGDEFLVLPAVGKNGRSAAQGPLQSFEEILLQP